jgi:hypothetical protein
MSEFNTIMKILDSEEVQNSKSVRDLIGTELYFGQSNWVCEYGTLSDGHEKITPSQRYYQSLKEIYAISNSLILSRADALEAQAELLDAEDFLKIAISTGIEKDLFKAEAKILRAKQKLMSAEDRVKDQLRILNAYQKVRKELENKVREKYPLGIEQAEQDNWIAVYEYRMLKEKTPGISRQQTDNIPLSPIAKAQLGFKHGRLDSIAPLAITDRESCERLENIIKIEQSK